MRALLPVASGTVDVHQFYADEWLGAGGLRVNFIASADGGATVAGRSAGLQTPGDNLVFRALRDLADVVVVGAGTAVAEGYRPVTSSERRRGVRRAFGLAAQLPTAVISRSLRLDPAAALFAESPPDARTVVLTCAAAPGEVRAALGSRADVVVCGDEEVDPALARAALVERGFTRMLAEGGPNTFAQLVQGGVVDELCLTQAPLLAGPGPQRIIAGNVRWARPARLVLAGLLEEDGALFLRYRLQRPQAASR